MPPSPRDFGFSGHFGATPSERREFAGASGILGAVPSAVAVPNGPEDLIALVRWATATGSPLIPRGAGTGMPGGNVGPGTIVDMVTGFREPVKLGPTTATARVQVGMTRTELNQAIAHTGFHFPVDPSSGARCTLGGMIANNAAGAHSVLYGATRAWIRSLDVVLANGTLATLTRAVAPEGPIREILADVDRAILPHRNTLLEHWPRVRKNSSGYALREYIETGDAIDLIVGSEGTLALVAAATVDLAPLPSATGLLLLEFEDLGDAAEAILRILPLHPATCEILDRTFLDFVRRGHGDSAIPLDPAHEAILLVEVLGDRPEDATGRIDGIRNVVDGLARKVTAATDPDAVGALWAIRHAASPIIAREAGDRVSMQFIEDCVVPVDRLPDYILGLREILAQHRLPAAIFGHAGDGNLHVNPLVDAQQPDWQSTVQQVLKKIATLVIALGGTLAGEHGDGRLRAPLLRRIWGDTAFDSFTAVKSAFDPAGIFNPGVILPQPGQRPFDHLKNFG